MVFVKPESGRRICLIFNPGRRGMGSIMEYGKISGNSGRGSCIIVGAGEYHDSDDERIEPGDGDFCIAADGGISVFAAKNIVPDMIIGDMDSCEAGVLDGFGKSCASIIRLPRQKDDTDMLAAVREGLRLGYKSFKLYGALGGRIDHSIANIQLLCHIANNKARGTIYAKDTRLFMLCGGESVSFDNDMGKRYVSVFTYGENARGVCESGLKYEVENITLTNDFPIGVSNEFTGGQGRISVKEGMLLICIGAYI